ncbi:sentrin-specific protease 1-like [Drosophila miranda]|uniref:sentrin-specific protease 1-like n=1 Tax=Drosophila miranda TaxID=7229 RepID=UPI0007E61E9C|nr:sentrin-specific protease 1-like [Drosophila miranda]
MFSVASSDSKQEQSPKNETEYQEEVQAMQHLSGLFFRDDFEKETDFIPITDKQLQELQDIVTGPGNAPLISKYSLTITKKDIRTLTDLSWLNDTVINFYMNLLIERSQQKEEILPSVYSMSTLFLDCIFRYGLDAVKRWTRKIDVFRKDIILVPVHCNGNHWCMAIIHFQNRTIFYYDSLGNPNDIVLDVLKNYIIAESLDKRKVQYDLSGFRIENVLNGPQQTNGSDCGVFSCMTAEYITRGKPLTFNQEHMSYFRKKMILEIVHGQLWK